MPSKLIRSITLFFVLVFLANSLSGCRAFRRIFHKKKAPPKVEQKVVPSTAPAVPETLPSAATQPAKPPTPPVPSPEMAPAPETKGIQIPPMPPRAPLPETQALPESAGSITVSAGAEKKVAEGSYFIIDDAQAVSVSNKPLTYQWSLFSGPPDRIQIVRGDVLQGAFKILNLGEPTPFTLKLTVSDGSSQASSNISVTGYPVRLELKSHLGGITRQVERIGEMTYVSRGRTLEIYDPQFSLVDKVNLNNPILKLSGFMSKGKSYLYALTEAGEWLLLDVTDPKAVGQSMIQKMEIPFKDLRVNSAGEEVWGISVTKDEATLWSLNDVTRPQIKWTSKGSYQGLKGAVLRGKMIYLADRQSLYSVDATTGVVLASIPTGGAVTGLDVVESGAKPSFVLTLGEGTPDLQKGDFGLRIFEIGPGGKLTNEQRFHLKGNPAVMKLHVVTNTTKLLLGVKQQDQLELRVFELATKAEIPLDIPPDLKLTALSDMATGRLNNIPMAVLADASALRVLKFNPVGNPPSRYKVEIAQTSFSTLAAGAVKMAPGGGSVFLLDFGSTKNPLVPALLEIGTTDLATKGTLILGDYSYLSDFVLTDRPRFNFAANLNDHLSEASSPETHGVETQAVETRGTPETSPPVSSADQGRGINEGTLRVFSTEAKSMKTNVSATRIFGGIKEPNESRSFGIDAYSDSSNIIVATAMGKVKGVGVRSGLSILKLTPDMDPAVILKGDLNSKITYIPLNDARDVKLANNGKLALVAAGLEGLVLVDLEKNQVVAKSNPNPGSIADRVLLSADQKKVFVSFLSSSLLATQGADVSMSVYYFNEGKLGLWGSMKGLSSVTLPYGVRTGASALSADDVYLFVANGKEGVWVYNTSDPSAPVLISKLSTYGEAAGVAVGQKYKNIYIADLVNGLELAEFGF
jgi:hypothetical protein